MLKTLTRVALILLGSLLLLLALVLLLLQTPVANTMVENRLRAWVHPALQVNGDVQVGVLPKLGIDLSNVTIPSRQGTHPALSINRVQFQVSWTPLLERRLVIEDFHTEGLDIFIDSDIPESSRSNASEKASEQASPLLGWIHNQLDDGAWELSIKQALVEKLAVFGVSRQAGDVALAGLEQLELKAEVNWPVVGGSSASLGLRNLLVNDTEQFASTSALLEQLGIASNGEWDVIALDSNWTLERANSGQADETILHLLALTASGVWGDISAADGTIDLSTGQIAIPMQATLTNSPKFKSRAVEINVRQSKMRFELTGTVDSPGVKWLSQLRSTR